MGGGGGVVQFLVLLLIVSLFAWFYARDINYCVVTSDDNILDGFYKKWNNNYYYKNGGPITSSIDVFALYAMRHRVSSDAIIMPQNGRNLLIKQGKVKYRSNQGAMISLSNTEIWSSVDSDNSTISVRCEGNRELTKSMNPPTNLQLLTMHPITTLLLGIITFVAYYLWEHRIDVAAISFSYQAFVVDKQYWRAFTASLSHVDLMHFAFNTMSLYQLGFLEDSYGSLTYAYLSFVLIFITILICTFISFWMITRYGRNDFISQQSIGYSCVLFAWMVAASVRMPQFCPIIFLPNFCFSTWTIPIPFTYGLRVNLGPIILLLVTKIIIPRSSFIGHLSGIIIGYPLAWNWLNGLSPPIYCSILFMLSCWAISDGFSLSLDAIRFWMDCTIVFIRQKLAICGLVNEISIPETLVEAQYCANTLGCIGFVVSLSYIFSMITIVDPFPQLVPRFTVIAFVVACWCRLHYAIHSPSGGAAGDQHNLIAITRNSSFGSQPGYVLSITPLLVAGICLYDFCNFTATVASIEFIEANLSSSSMSVYSNALIWFLLSLSEFILFLVALRALHDETLCLANFHNFKVDSDKFEADINALGLRQILNLLGIIRIKAAPTRAYFSGVGHRLQPLTAISSHQGQAPDPERQGLLSSA